MRQLTPLKAIRIKCVDCAGGEMKAVRSCQHDDCSHYLLRLGKGSRKTMKPIRAFCISCCNDQRDEVRQCPSVKCPLWQYRFGKRLKNTQSLPEILTTEGVLKMEIVNRGNG